MNDNKKELLEEAIENIRNHRYAETLGVLDELAEEGNRVAMYWLAKRYKQGFRIGEERPRKSIRPDWEKSQQLLQQSADLGFPPAQYALGKHFYLKSSKDRDLPKAFSLFKAAAEQGFVPAMRCLAECYCCAQGTPLNHQEGIRWYKKATEAGHPFAAYHLAKMYEEGYDIDNDDFGPIVPAPVRVFQMFGKAAEIGSRFGQYELALCYLDGRGTDKDETKAIEWLKKSAGMGLSNAADKLKELGITWEGKTHITLIER